MTPAPVGSDRETSAPTDLHLCCASLNPARRFADDGHREETQGQLGRSCCLMRSTVPSGPLILDQPVCLCFGHQGTKIGVTSVLETASCVPKTFDMRLISFQCIAFLRGLAFGWAPSCVCVCVSSFGIQFRGN